MTEQNQSKYLGKSYSVVNWPYYRLAKGLVNGINTISLLYHCSSWSVLSIVRYVYIVHENWLHQRFPDVLKVTQIAMTGYPLML